jgi:valyl-tRNA synthetase
VTEAMEKCQFNIAVEEIRNFTWHVFCDCYVEAVKDRLYRPEVYGEAKRAAAQHALSEVLYWILQLLAPVAPHLTEEIYQTMYAKHKGYRSLQLSPWPKPEQVLVDEQAEKSGDLIMALITEVRREKAEKRMPLNSQVKRLRVYAGDGETAEIIKEGGEDIAGTCKVASLEVNPERRTSRRGRPIGGKEIIQDGREVAQFPKVYFITEY